MKKTYFLRFLHVVNKKRVVFEQPLFVFNFFYLSV